MSSTDPKWNSPGNTYALNNDTPPMRRPGMEFIWRCEADIADKEILVGAPHKSGVVRSIANIVGGKVKGPRGIEGEVLGVGGADWATVIEGTHSMTLNARYTIILSDSTPLFVRAKGIYRPGPGTSYAASVASNPAQTPVHTATQDDVEFFSHLRIEAGGDGKWNWLNGLVCVGVMCCIGTRIVIDAYYLTNFPGVEPESVVVR